MELINKLGEIIPSIGLGTFPFQGIEMANIVKSAVKFGYRLFDTADDYWGEPGIGIAVKELIEEGQFKRENLFLQTKISDNNAHEKEPQKGYYFNPNSKFMQRHSAEEIVRSKVETSLHNMNTDYIDSLLIHYPLAMYNEEVWKSMIDLKKEGLVRYIGVSNFHKRHIEKLISSTGVCPEINEIYISPINTKNDIIEYCNKMNIQIITYSPLMDIAQKRIPLDTLKPIMEKYSKNEAQIVLRWNIQRGCIPLPKTKNLTRLSENINVFDFELTKDEMESISKLNCDYQYLVESQICPGL